METVSGGGPAAPARSPAGSSADLRDGGDPPVRPLHDAPVARRVATVLSAGAILLALLWAAALSTWIDRLIRAVDWPSWLADGANAIGLGFLHDQLSWFYNNIYVTQIIVLVLGAATAVILLRNPWRGREVRTRVPAPDMVLASLAMGVSLWLAWRFPVLDEDAFYHPTEVLIIGGLLVPLVIEALRRASGPSLFLVVLGFVVYALLGDMIPGALQAKTQDVGDLVSQLGLDTTMMLGRPLVIGVVIVLPFIFFGQLLLRSGGADFFADLAAALMGRRRGGSAKVAVTASAFFGSISGSAVSNVASTGVVTIPMMRRGGYSPQAAGAIESVASTGGQLTPPVMGAAAFLMAELLRAPYQDIVVAAILPAALFYLALFVHVDLIAGRRGIRPLEAAEVPRLGTVLRQGGFLLFPFVVLIAVLFGLNENAETAALAACLVLAISGSIRGYGGHRLNWRQLGLAVRDAGYLGLTIVVITAAAGIVIGLLDKTELGFGLTLLLVELGKSHLLILLGLTAIVCIVLGMGMPTTGVYFLVASIAAKPLVDLGVLPIAAHMFVFYYGMLSMITPPVAIAAFTAANLSGAPPMATAWMSVRLGWPAYVIPFLFVLSPTLLLQGETGEVLLSLGTAAVGVWAITAAVAGFLSRALELPLRAALAIGGIALVLPANAVASGNWLNLAGAVLVLGTVAWLVAGQRRQATG